MRSRFRLPEIKKPQHKNWPDPELARALAPLGKKILLRYWLESARLALLWGLAVAVALLALTRLWLFPAYVAAALGAAVFLAVAGLRVYLRPDALTVVHAADAAGLDGTAVTSFRLREQGSKDAWSLAAETGGMKKCRIMSPKLAAEYPVVSGRRPWGGAALLAAVLLAYVFLPNPLAAYWTEVREEREALKLAAREAQAAVERVKDVKVNGNNVLPDDVRKQMQSLPGDIRSSGDRQEAANKLEMARWQLDQARAVMGATAKKDLERLAASWDEMNGKTMKSLAGALRKGDSGEIDRAVQNLAEEVQKAGAEEKKQIAAALYNGAGAVSDPALRKALRDAAGAALDDDQKGDGASGTASGGQGENGMAAAAGALSSALASTSQTAAAGAALGGASSTMASLAGGLAGGAAPGSMGLASADAGGAMNGAGGTAAGGTEPGAGSAAGGGTGSGGEGDGGDGGSQSGQNGGNSGNSGTGNGTGGGGQGSGGSGAGHTGGGLNLVYTPFLNGNGEKSQVSGQVREGQSGNEVSLESSPTTLGELRPYQEVYGEYMAEAHESLSRAPLPPEMENLVWRYFSTLSGESQE